MGIVAVPAIVIAIVILGVLVAPFAPTATAAGVVAFVAISAIVLPVSLVIGLALLVLTVFLFDAWRSAPIPELVLDTPRNLSRGVPAPFVARSTVARGTHVWLRQSRPVDLHLEPNEGDGGFEGIITGMRRGHYELPGMAARVTGPLRLASWRRTLSPPRAVDVYPDMPAARRLALAVRTNKFRDPGRITRGPLGLGTEFESIREYLPDDDLRQVNWRATARTGHPMSNQFRVEQDRDLLCMLDCGRLMAAPLGDRNRLDAAVDALTAVAMVADAVGDRCGVVAFDRTVTRAVPPRRYGSDLVVRNIYDVEPLATDAAYECAFRSIGTKKRAFVLVFTDLLDLAAARFLLDAIPVLVRRHAVVIASVIDPDIERAVATGSESTSAAYVAAVALDVLDERRRVVARLQHAGAEVLEAERDDFSAACVSVYLRAKQRARV
jgi:uncharacterized protein (DUF58 family)